MDCGTAYPCGGSMGSIVRILVGDDIVEAADLLADFLRIR